MIAPEFRGEIPAIAAQIAATREREFRYAAYVQARVKADTARTDPGLKLAQAADRSWDDYADECERLAQCTAPGCYITSAYRAYCPQHDDNPPDFGD